MTTGRINQVARDEGHNTPAARDKEMTQTASARAPRPAFDTRPTRTRTQSIRDATTERFSPEVHSPMSRSKATHRSTHQHAIARLRKGRNANALAANSTRAQRTANADRHAERHIERPLKERSPMLSLGSASHPPTRPLNRSRPRKTEKTQPSSAT